MSHSSQTVSPNRLQIHNLDGSANNSLLDNGQDVIEGLTRSPKTLPPRYFYDDYGSQLFEQICDLPEYYPTRTETWILKEYADAIATHTGACDLIELGSGSSTKTRFLLDAYQRQGDALYYQPIDVSAGILEESAQQLLMDYPRLQILAHVGTYEQALAALPPTKLAHRMLIFLGSSLGNFTPKECDRFFAQVTAVLSPGDFFLLGVDLQKDNQILQSAYNDAKGITATFNRNILTHLNQRFRANFEPRYFAHQAIYNDRANQIEMYLRCQKDHQVDLKALNLTIHLLEGESIQTEISRKFDLLKMRQYLQARGLSTVKVWSDLEKWFGVILCQCQV